MAYHFPAGRTSRIPAFRAGRQCPDIHSRKIGGGQAVDSQFHRTQMGVHVHYPGPVRRSLLRILPAVLQHEFLRGLLGLGADSHHLRFPGRLVRIPEQGRQYTREDRIQSIPYHQRLPCAASDRNGGRHILHRLTVHRGQECRGGRPRPCHQHLDERLART